MKRELALIGLVAIALLPGCGNEVNDRSERQADAPTVKAASVSMVLLEQSLVAGTARQVLDSRFGEPITEIDRPNGNRMALYVLPVNEVEDRKNVLKGFQLFYTNGFLKNWFPVYGDTEVVRDTGRSDEVPEQQAHLVKLEH